MASETLYKIRIAPAARASTVAGKITLAARIRYLIRITGSPALDHGLAG